MKKILITYASYGSGHKTVANYVYEYFKENSDYEIQILDLMDYATTIGKFDRKLFDFTSNNKINLGFAYSLYYNLFDNRIATAPYKEFSNVILKSSLKKKILEYNPDILISTHFFGGITMGQINKKYNTNTKIITIVTDYYSHALWLQNHKYENYYIVSNEIVKEQLINFGIDENKICPYGIPLSSKFKNVNSNTTKIKYKYNIKNDKPIILFFGGGSNGSTFTYRYLKQILKENLDINIIFISGKNVELQNKCNKLIEKENYKNITVLGFTNDVSNLLNIATLVITKPGGISVTETVEMKKPMILIPGNGGQENYNAKFVTRNKFGIKVHNQIHLAKALSRLIKNPILIKNMYLNLKNYEENKSIEKLFNLVKEELK